MKNRFYIKLIFILLFVFLCPSFFVEAKETLEITDVKIVEKSATVVADNVNYNDNNILSAITFQNVNDFIVYEIQVKNNLSETYLLNSISNQITNENISIYSTSVGKKIDSGALETFHVKIQYVKELLNENKTIENCKLDLRFANSGTIVSPLTDNNAKYNIILLIVFILILLVIFIKEKHPSLLLLIILLIPYCVYAKNDEIITLNINNININGKFLEYKVTIRDSNDDILDTYVKTYGKEINELPSVSPKEGYVFDKWVDMNNKPVTAETIVKDDLLIYAKYTPIVYSITYNLNGGYLANNNPTQYTIEDSFELSNPTKTGYNFAGWLEVGSGLLQTKVTIYKGTTGDKTFMAAYTPNENTIYTVEHYKMNIEGNYVLDETEKLRGTTGTEVSPQPKQIEGFKTPNIQTIVIAGDGSSKISYYYERKIFEFIVNNRAYLESGTLNGLYYYGTTIEIKAKERAGYTFKWSDDSTNYSRRFTLSDNINLTPIYTPNEDTPYTVIYEQMNLDGITYRVKEQTIFHGTTDTTVTPLPNIYDGFITPEPQELLITGDGNAKLVYKYVRKKFTLTLEREDHIITSIQSGEYFYGTEIVLKAKELDGEVFIKWSNGDENIECMFLLTADITIFPVYQVPEIDIDYTGTEETITIPQTGYYRLEVWGAQGGSIPSYRGGYGGYSSGIIHLNKDDILYVNVGGEGKGATAQGQNVTGGYNGGGNVKANTGVNHINASGGGATHIAVSTGLIEEFEEKRQDLIMVAGGGGGARNQSNHWREARWGYGGSGGGAYSSGAYSNYNTYDVTQQNTCIASQTSGISFGKPPDISGNSGGGGGLYAGYTGGGFTDTSICPYLGTGSGGSGYIGYNNLNNKYMLCFNCQPSYISSEFSISSICHSVEALSDCSKEDDGHAKITYIGIEEPTTLDSQTLKTEIQISNNTSESLIRNIHVVEGMTFASDNEDVLIINNQGIITTKSVGKAKVTLTYNNYSIIYKISVVSN